MNAATLDQANARLEQSRLMSRMGEAWALSQSMNAPRAVMPDPRRTYPVNAGMDENPIMRETRLIE